MNAWASEGKYDCNFLCVCVLGDRSAYPLAKEMSQESKLTHCVNGFIDNNGDMPNYGQLGCKGFIVLDADHRVVSNSTPAFMEVKGIAFAHVEALLDSVCTKLPLPSIIPGDHMTLERPPPSQPDLKGAMGICVKAKVAEGKVHFGFLAGPLRGRIVELPVTAVAKADLASQGGCGCDSGSCGQGQCGEGQCGCGEGAAKGSPSGCDGQGQCGCGEGGGKCSPSGCDGQGGCDGSGAIEEDIVDSALNLPSVKVPSMDSEHAECAAALRSLVIERTHTALQEVLTCLKEHFEHEEALFVEHDFGAHANENLSARKSHMEDHRRILGLIQNQLQASQGKDLIRADFIKEVLRDFHDHTSRYDTQYAEPLSSKGVQ